MRLPKSSCQIEFSDSHQVLSHLVYIVGNVLCARLWIKVEQSVHDDCALELSAMSHTGQLVWNEILVHKVFTSNGALCK